MPTNIDGMKTINYFTNNLNFDINLIYFYYNYLVLDNRSWRWKYLVTRAKLPCLEAKWPVVNGNKGEMTSESSHINGFSIVSFSTDRIHLIHTIVH